MKPIFNTRKRRGKGATSSASFTLRERLGEDPLTGWVVVLAVTAIVALALVGPAAWLFHLIAAGAILPDAPAASAGHSAFDRQALESLLGGFDRRSADYSAQKRGYDGPPDPSR